MRHKHLVVRCNCPPCGYALGRGGGGWWGKRREEHLIALSIRLKKIIQQELLFVVFVFFSFFWHFWGSAGLRCELKNYLKALGRDIQCRELSARQCYWFPLLQMWQLMWALFRTAFCWSSASPWDGCELKFSDYSLAVSSLLAVCLSVRVYYEVQYGRSGPRASISRHCCVSAGSVEHSCPVTVRLERSLLPCSFLQWRWLLLLRNLLKSPPCERAQRLDFIHRYLRFSLSTV